MRDTEKSGKQSRYYVCGAAPSAALLKWAAPDGNYDRIDTRFSSRIITPSGVVVVSTSYLGRGGLALIARTRAAVRRALAAGEVAEVDHEPRFARVMSYWPRSWLDATEVDIRGAYVRAARLIGAIDAELYLRLQSVSKKMRLIAIGSLATEKHHFTYREGVRVGYTVEVDADLKNVWRKIVSHVDKSVDEAGRNVAWFSWCDAVFARRGAGECVTWRLLRQGYASKRKDCAIRRFGGGVQVDDGRVFSLPYKGAG